MIQLKKQVKVYGEATPAGWTYAGDYPKGTREFFQNVLQRRFTEECKWMFDVVQFERFNGKKF